MVEKTKYAMKQMSVFLPEMIARPLAILALCQMDLHPVGNKTEGKKNFKVPGLGGVDCNHHHHKVIDMSPKAASLTVHFTEKENKVRRRK